MALSVVHAGRVDPRLNRDGLRDLQGMGAHDADAVHRWKIERRSRSSRCPLHVAQAHLRRAGPRRVAATLIEGPSNLRRPGRIWNGEEKKEDGNHAHGLVPSNRVKKIMTHCTRIADHWGNGFFNA